MSDRSLYLAGIVVVLVVCVAFLAILMPPKNPVSALPPQGSDKLSEVLTTGKMVIASQTAYPPWSDLRPNASRPQQTKCAPNEYTSEELTGFDVDVATEVSRRLGVEPCFVTPPRTQVFSGSWADAWDIGIGSITITRERMKVLYFSQPYKSTPSVFFVHRNNIAVTKPADLTGKKIGVCAGCIQERYLQGTLDIPGETIDFIVKNATIVAYSSDTMVFPEVASGNLDAALVNEGIGLAAIQNGTPVRELQPSVYFAPVAAVVDKKSSRDPVSFVTKVSGIIQDMHEDGTLSQFILRYYERDITRDAAGFNISALGQFPLG